MKLFNLVGKLALTFTASFPNTTRVISISYSSKNSVNALTATSNPISLGKPYVPVPRRGNAMLLHPYPVQLLELFITFFKASGFKRITTFPIESTYMYYVFCG